MVVGLEVLARYYIEVAEVMVNEEKQKYSLIVFRIEGEPIDAT